MTTHEDPIEPWKIAVGAIILIVFIASCGSGGSSGTINDQFNSLKHPVIVAGTGESVLLLDDNGKYLVVWSGSFLSESLQNYKAGDTIIHKNP